MKKIKKVTKIWTKKDGSKIRICDMTDSHLTNTIKMLERNAREHECEALGCFPSFQGEMAQYYAELAWDSIAENGIDPNEITPLYDDLLLEKQRRNLK
jgi:hypothetical protein